MITRTIFAVGIILGISSCSPVSKTSLTKKFQSLETKLQDHTGFMLYDPAEKKELFSYHANQYFTPASNTKIFTFYSGLMLLGDSVPALQYIIRGDSLFFRGTGDPSFLYQKSFDSGKVFAFLKTSNKKLFLIEDNFFAGDLGPGWAWDDYRYTYSSERSAFPLYGNYFTAEQLDGSLKIYPTLFSYDVSIADSTDRSKIEREKSSNKIAFHPGRTPNGSKKWDVPFKTNAEVTALLLSDTLKSKVSIFEKLKMDSAETLYSVPTDSLYKTMMQESDNFIAEQLLLMCAGVVSDSLKPEIAISFMKKNYLTDLPDKPVWVDGSGLSRYNLFTPRSIVKLWEKIYERVPRQRLFPLLAIGGKTGTIKNWYKNEPPYIYGKTGTLSNNHSLSGYLITKSGRMLIFSFMNNNHPASASTVRNEMAIILKSLYEHY